MKRINKSLLSITILLLITLNISAQQPEGNSVKGQINLNAFVQVPIVGIEQLTLYGKSCSINALYYSIDASYGISKYFDMGIYYSYNYISEDKFQEAIGYDDYSYTHNFGIESRYFLTSYFIKKPVKYDFYLKGFIGMESSKRYTEIYDWFISMRGNVGLLLGVKYNPIKRLGIMAEFGYGLQSSWTVNMGLSLRIKK